MYPKIHISISPKQHKTQRSHDEILRKGQFSGWSPFTTAERQQATLVLYFLDIYPPIIDSARHFFFLFVLCVPENLTTPGHSALCLCLCSLWASSAQVDKNDFSTVSIFFISSLALTTCFSLPPCCPLCTKITFCFNFACFLWRGVEFAVQLWFTL